jgi:hypothetical protein
MASELLSVPEEHLREVILVIRKGLASVKAEKVKIKADVRRQLTKWCDEEEEYLECLEGDDEDE